MIVSADVEVFVNLLDFASTVPTFLDLVQYPFRGLAAIDFDAVPLATRPVFDFFASDLGFFVPIDVTSLMQAAQVPPALVDFQLRFSRDMSVPPLAPSSPIGWAPNGEPVTPPRRGGVLRNGRFRRRSQRNGGAAPVTFLRGSARGVRGFCCRIVLVPATRTRNKLADLGAVAAGLAHEIRNPLNSLYINGQLLEEMLSELPEEGVPQKGDLLSLARANLKVTQRLNDTLSGFLRFARPPAMELALVDLNRIVSETLRFLEMELAYRGVSLKTKLHPTPLPILADEKLLKQALLNLLLNAQEAVEKEEKVIRVTTGVRAGRPFVRIRDNGRGIPPSDRRHIFRLFFTTRKNGSGLGLPIVRQIVRQHGGAVYVRSREGKGTTMTVALLFEEQFRAMYPGRLPLALPQGGRP